MYFKSSLSEHVFQAAHAAFLVADYTGSENLVRRVLASNPAHTQATLLLARLFLLSNREKPAADALKNLLRREPESAEANQLLADALFRIGEPHLAFSHGQRALELGPDNAGVAADFMMSLQDNSQVGEAQSILLNVLRSHAQDSPFCNLLADRFIQRGRPESAVPALRAVIAIEPDRPDGWVRFARLQFILGNNAASLEAAEMAVRVGESCAAAHNFLGSLLTGPADEARAAKHFTRAIELDPTEWTAYSSLGILLQKQGKFEEAKAFLMKSVELYPSHGTAHYMLFRARTLTRADEPLIENLYIRASDAAVNLVDRGYLAYAAAKGWEDLGSFDKSIRAYDLANQLAYQFWAADKPWDKADYRSSVTRLIETVTGDLVRELQPDGCTSDMPVLIVGMPRSGTTLVEHILTSHPAAAGGSELDFWTKNFGRVYGESGEPINVGELQKLGREYLELLTQIGKGATRVTDKMPHNFSVLGLVAAAFPKAKFIHVRRNAFENCLSIYTTAFAPPPIYSMKWEDIAFAYAEYRRITAHWRQILPSEQLLEIDYEALVSDSETVTRRIIEFVGLPWDDACLHPERNKREVLTASLWQVRQPIYSSSVDRSKGFQPWLTDVAALIERAREGARLI